MQISVFLFFGSRRKLVFGFEEEEIVQKAMIYISIYSRKIQILL